AIVRFCGMDCKADTQATYQASRPSDTHPSGKLHRRTGLEIARTITGSCQAILLLSESLRRGGMAQLCHICRAFRFNGSSYAKHPTSRTFNRAGPNGLRQLLSTKPIRTAGLSAIRGDAPH